LTLLGANPLGLRPHFGALEARVAELVDAADSDNNLSPLGEILEVKPVKVGEGPEQICSS